MAHGGKRPGAGRKAGSPNKLSTDASESLVDRVKRVIEDGITPVEYLLGIMRDEDEDDDRRLQAAGMAANYVHKKQPQDVNNTMTFPTPLPVTFTHTAPPDLPDDTTAD